MAIADLIMSIGGVVFPMVSATYQRWVFGDIGCQAYAFATNFVGNLLQLICPKFIFRFASRSNKSPFLFLVLSVAFQGIGAINILTLLAFERGQMVRNGALGNHWEDKSPFVSILAAWSAAFVATFPPLVGWGRYDREGPGIR